jgi:hypothetical protein
MDIPAFRKLFIEFVDPETYPDGTIEFWATMAGKLLPESRWGDFRDYGSQLFVAHHLVVGLRDQLAAEADTVPGEVKGIVSSKSVDKVSVSYDSSKVALSDGGFWNMSTYGIRFLSLARKFGAGPIQL